MACCAFSNTHDGAPLLARGLPCDVIPKKMNTKTTICFTLSSSKNRLSPTSSVTQHWTVLALSLARASGIEWNNRSTSWRAIHTTT